MDDERVVDKQKKPGAVSSDAAVLPRTRVIFRRGKRWLVDEEGRPVRPLADEEFIENVSRPSGLIYQTVRQKNSLL